jgi:hypothetical protein
MGRTYEVVAGDTVDSMAQQIYGDSSWSTTLPTVNQITGPKPLAANPNLSGSVPIRRTLRLRLVVVACFLGFDVAFSRH